MFSRLGTKGLDPERMSEILDGDEKKTAGQLVAMLRTHTTASDELQKGLEEALAARNKFVHQYLVENVERFIDINEHEVIVREIYKIRSTVRKSRNQLDPFIRGLVERIDGLDMEAMMEEDIDKFMVDTDSQ